MILFQRVDFRAAMGAILEIRIYASAALIAGSRRAGGRSAQIGIDGIDILFTPIAHEKGRPFFHAPDRNEKQAQIVVNPAVIRLMKAAHRTAHWIVIQFFGFWLHTGNENKREHKKSGIMVCW